MEDRLEEFIGQNGMVMLLSFLDIGPYLEADYQGPRVKDMREFVEFEAVDGSILRGSAAVLE